MTGAERGHAPSVGDAGSKPQALLEYEAAIAGARLEHLIACKARDYVRYRGTVYGPGHYRALQKLVRQL